MNELPITYSYFLAALRMSKKNEGPGFQNRLAITLEKSEAYISKVINKKAIASFNLQNAIAEASGYSYLDFLQIGRELVEGRTTKDVYQNTPLTKSKRQPESIPSIGEIIKVYNSILEKTGMELNVTAQEKLFNLIKRKLQEFSVDTAEEELLDIISLAVEGTAMDNE